MKSKFLMTLPALLAFPIVSASCTEINQNNSSAENKTPDSDSKNKVDNVTTDSAHSNKNQNDNKSNTEQPAKDQAETYSALNDKKQKEKMLKHLKEDLTKLKEKKAELEKIVKDNESTEKELKKVWEDLESKASTSNENGYDESKLKNAYEKWLTVYDKLTSAKNELEIFTKSEKIEKTEQAIKKLETELKAK
ncbi:Hypothetical protein, predicted lipoprotein [Mycoplasmopsis agalactiae 14628]|uniref:Lipoprotein n=1 Tax=Mycoplasmopsis agalactiae 14628 TaxID=1110504 RepID=I5D640_MYCAA|nr:hypothetical protein [Mycoplasmopsis agalactiae]EIN15149.1 Hypothetical protein, predicted lipoprotein [Mycoplasmopsis agalactiae 14628]